MIVKILFIILNIFAIFSAFGALLEKDKEGNQYREKLFCVLMGLFINDVTMAFLLSLVGIYSLGIMCIILAVEISACVLFIYRTKKYEYLADAIRRLTRGGNYALLIVLLIAGILYCAYPTYYMWAGRDPAIYLINGASIAQTGSYQLPDSEIIDENYEDIKSFTELTYAGIYSDYEEGDSAVPSRVTSQFLQYFSAALAIGYSLAGLEGLVRVNALIGVLCILTIYYFSKKVMNKEVGLIAAVLLACNPAQLWSARITQTELLYQLYVFWGLYIFVKAWRENRADYAFLAGGIFASIGLNRVDGYIVGAGVLSFACYANLWIRERKRISMYLCGAYALGSILSIGYSYIYSRYYFVSQQGVKPAIILDIILGCAVILTYYLGNLKKVQNNAIFDKAMNSRKIRYILFAIGIILFMLCYFWRPTLQTGVGKGRDFAKRALVEFCWYISTFAIPFFFYGLWKIVDDREKRRELLLLLAIGFSNLLIYIIRPSITPDHFWASRRWISVAYPFVLFIVAVGVQMLPTLRRMGRTVCNPIKILVLLLLTGYALYQCQLFISVSMMKELPGQYEELAENMNSGELYLARNGQVASILRFVYGKDVVAMKEDSQQELYQYLAEGRRAMEYVGEIDALQSNFYCQLLTEAEIRGTYVKETFGEYPSELTEKGNRADLYLIKPVDVAIEGEGYEGWATRRIPMDVMMFQTSELNYGERMCSSSADGTFMYGPYWSMRAGEYVLEVDIQLVEREEIDVFGVLEVTTDAGEKLVAQCLIDISDFGEESATFSLPFSLETDAEKVEFRVRKNEGCILEVSEVRYSLEAND